MTSRRRYAISDINQFSENFKRESDRACAVLARALLEDMLRQHFEQSFVTGTDATLILDGQAPLATFSARIRVAAALGWLSADEAADLHQVRSIGNDFAHGLDHTMTFEDASIRDRVLALHAPHLILRHDHRTDKPAAKEELEHIRMNVRRRFEIAVWVLWAALSERLRETARREPVKSLLMRLDEQAREEEAATKSTVGVNRAEQAREDL